MGIANDKFGWLKSVFLMAPFLIWIVENWRNFVKKKLKLIPFGVLQLSAQQAPG